MPTPPVFQKINAGASGFKTFQVRSRRVRAKNSHELGHSHAISVPRLSALPVALRAKNLAKVLI